MEGDEPATRELPRILHSTAPSQGCRVFAGRSVATWMVVRPGTRIAARALDPRRWSQQWRIGPFLPRSTASRGGGEAFRDFLLDGRFLLACPGFFRLRGAWVASVRSWTLPPPRRGGVRMSSLPGAKTFTVCPSSDSLAGARRVGSSGLVSASPGSERSLGGFPAFRLVTSRFTGQNCLCSFRFRSALPG
jgi:hypothetical protein